MILYNYDLLFSRDYCTSGRHVVSMCANVIKVSVYLQVLVKKKKTETNVK